jgi:hypothetical protein
MFADDKSSRLSRVKPPIDSGMEPPIKPPSSTAVSFSAFTSPDEQVTPAHPHTSLSGEPVEQDQPVTPREPMWVEATTSHMVLDCVCDVMDVRRHWRMRMLSHCMARDT